jgi:hypothetical protein
VRLPKERLISEEYLQAIRTTRGTRRDTFINRRPLSQCGRKGIPLLGLLSSCPWRKDLVEGWAFTFSSDSIPDAATPHLAPNFSRICGLVKTVPAGKKRIGLVVDFGSAFLRPKGEKMPRNFTKCVVVDKNAVGVDVLSQVVKVRTEGSGFICAFSNYPAKECGAEITTPVALIHKK